MADRDEIPLFKESFEILSSFRYQLRKFVRFSETIARKNGVTPLQYLMMLHIKGFPGRDWATVSELAERLQAKHHGVVSLITRCEKLNLVERRRSPVDGRRIEVHLLPKGEEIVYRLARLHRDQLCALEGQFVVPVLRLDQDKTVAETTQSVSSMAAYAAHSQPETD